MKEDVLPEGWEKTKLGKYLYLKNGYAFKKTDYVEKSKHSYPIIRISDINNFTATDKNAIHTNYIAKGFELEKNDLLIAMSGATTGKLGVYKGNIPAYQNQRVGNLKLIGKGDSQFRNYLMLSLQELIEKLAYGGAQPNISGKIIEDIDINLPPLPEQQYLSQKLTALLDEVAQTKQRLEAIPAQLKQFRQSVLADAVSGRLMEIAPRMTKMSDIAKFQNGFAFNSEDFSKSGEWQVFRLGNIRDGFLFYENKPVFISEKLAKTQEKFIPKVGDSLISMTGTRFKQDYGFACIIEKDEKILVNQRVGRIIPIKDKIIPKFLNLSLRSEHFRQQFFKGETGGVNQGNVGSKHIMSISINLPTLEQQTQIVQKVETYFALADEIETQVNAALENVNLLTQSILSKAFSGELSAAWRTQQAVKN